MPIYEYRCNACRHEFEELVRSAAESRTAKCPKCGESRAERKLSVFAARQGAQESFGEATGGCGRCGDPEGPCGF